MPAKAKAKAKAKATRSQLTTLSLRASELAAPEELLLGEEGCDQYHQDGVDQATHDTPEW